MVILVIFASALDLWAYWIGPAILKTDITNQECVFAVRFSYRVL